MRYAHIKHTLHYITSVKAHSKRLYVENDYITTNVVIGSDNGM